MKVKLFHEKLSQLHKLQGRGEKKEAAQGQQGVRNSPSHLAALDARFPFLSLRDIFPRPGEVVLGDGALDMAAKFPGKLQSFRHSAKASPWGSC